MCPLSWSARMKICRLSRGRQRNDLFYRPSNNGSFSRIGSLHAAQWERKKKEKKRRLDSCDLAAVAGGV